MSGEFGSDCRFWINIENAADDLLRGGDDLTKLWGKFFNEFKYVAKDIAWSEAYDSGPYAPILENIKRMDQLKMCLKDIENYLQVFKDVQERAICKALQDINNE